MHTLALIYIIVLGGILAAGVKSPHLGWLRACLGVFLLVWAVLIVTAQLLSLFSLLNVTWLYIGMSIVIATGTSVGLWWLRPTYGLTFSQFESPFKDRLAAWVAIFLVVSGLFVFLSDLKLAAGLLPSNPDSIVYRFPRVYWYFSQGSLEHFSNQGEPRPLFYPFNGTIAYFPLLHFHLGPRSFSLLSLLCWLMAGLSTYVFARDLGGPRVAAAATAWIICLTPNVLIQSLSTNDELIAAAPLLAGLFFLHRWYHARLPFDALIGVIGVAISAGTKLHITFYMPLVIMLAAVLIFHYRAAFQEIRNWLTLRGFCFVALLCVIVIVFTFSFMIYNYRASGQLLAWDLAAQVENKPFSILTALQNIVLYSAQVVLTPIADLHVGAASRGPHYQAFNNLFAPLFTWVNNGPTFTSAFYRFTGINSTQAVLFNEQTVFIGFTWFMALMAAIWLTRRWDDSRALWARFQIASLPVWFAAFAASSRYIEGVSVYLSYATIVAAPAMVYAFAPINRPRIAQLRLVFLAGIAVTQAFFAVSIVYTSAGRNLRVLSLTKVHPVSPGFAVDQSVSDEIGRAKNGVDLHAIAWGQPHWAFMAFHPEIRFFLASLPDPIPVQPGEIDNSVSRALKYSRYVLTPRPNDPLLHVYSFPQFPAYGHAVPIRIPDKASPGLTWIGDLIFALGPEWVFAAGNGVETRYPGGDKYIVIHYSELSNFGRVAEPIIQITPSIYGLGQKDDLKFRFEIKIDGKLVSRSDWQAVPQVDLATPGLRRGNGILTVYVRNDNAGRTIYSTDAMLQSIKPLQLAVPSRSQ